MFGLITGSGFYDIPDLEQREQVALTTPFGVVDLTRGRWHGVDVGFVARHGADHSKPPHAINYRANVWGLRMAGAESIIATAVSGAINPAMGSGQLVLIDDFLNFSSGRAATFFDGTVGEAELAASNPPRVEMPSLDGVVHTDMSQPYDTELRGRLLTAAASAGVELIDGGVYVCTDGPRFETRAEIAMMGRLGGDLVGMTGFPEVALANELGVPYASIGVVSNPAAGLGQDTLSMDDIWAVIDSAGKNLFTLIAATIAGANSPDVPETP